MKAYCTLFDARFLTRGVALHASLLRTLGRGSFTLYVLCFDDLARQVLAALSLEGVVTVSLEEFESDELRQVKPSRSRGEYCWTCTSHWIHYVLEVFRVPEVTYLDADLFFFHAPDPLHAEFDRAGGSILLTEHRYTPRFDLSHQKGIYCVQFMTFRADAPGLAALSWWRERCTEWCFDRNEPGRFGDQKYLDDWSRRFSGVHVLEHPGGGIAPWNVQQFRVTAGQGSPLVDGHPLVFYHFHGLQQLDGGLVDLANYPLASEVVDAVYRPYLCALAAAERAVLVACPEFPLYRSARETGPRALLRSLVRRVRGTWQVRHLECQAA